MILNIQYSLGDISFVRIKHTIKHDYTIAVNSVKDHDS